jgi:hypothetical protein
MLANSYDIAVLPGDGIGIEVMDATLDLLRVVDQRYGVGLHFSPQQAGAFAGKVVAGISALVRPFVTYLFVIAYAAVKVAGFVIALEQGGDWKQVLTTMWGVDDMAVLNMILSFWFVGRVYERVR